MNNWIVAGILAGVAAYVVDWVLWSKVFTKGMDAFVSPPPPGQQVNMTPMLVKSGILTLLYGVVFAFVYDHFRNTLWTSAGALGGMELATTMWLPIAFLSLGSNVWYTKATALMNATMWAWLVRMNAAGLVVGILVKGM